MEQMRTFSSNSTAMMVNSDLYLIFKNSDTSSYDKLSAI